MDFIDKVILTRSSVRAFTGEAVDSATLDRLLRAGMAAPSAMNLQPWDFILVTDRAKLDALRETLPYAKMLDRAAAAILVCGDPAKSERHWVDDCSAATENILLAAHSLGLGAVWTAVHPDEDRIAPVRTILSIPASIVPLNVIPVGVIAGSAPAPKNKYNPAKIHTETW